MYNIENKPEAIKEVQKLLGIKKTGNYNIETRDKVLAIQKRFGIPRSGEVNYETFLILVNEYRANHKKNGNTNGLLFSPTFPYTYGDFDENIEYINSLIRDIFTDYMIESKLPYGNFYGYDTEKAVKMLRKIFMLQDIKAIDEELFRRMLVEKDAIAIKNRTN